MTPSARRIGAAPTVDRAAAQRRVIRVLVCIQVLGGVGVSIGLAVSTLAAARMSGSDVIGGSALTCAVIGAAGAAVLVARIAGRAGRRPSLTLGYPRRGGRWSGRGVGRRVDRWPLLLAGLVLLGAAHRGGGLAPASPQPTLAAPETPGPRPGVVVVGDDGGAVAGPNLGEPAQRLAGAIGLSRWRAVPGLRGGVRTSPPSVPGPDCARSAAAGPAGAVAGPAAASTGATAGGARAALRAAPAARLGWAGSCCATFDGRRDVDDPVHMGHGGAKPGQLVGLVISLHVVRHLRAEPCSAGWSTGWVAARARAGGLAVGAAGVVSGLAAGDRQCC